MYIYIYEKRVDLLCASVSQCVSEEQYLKTGLICEAVRT